MNDIASVGGDHTTEYIDSNYNDQEGERGVRNEITPADRAETNEQVDRDADEAHARHNMAQQRRRAEHHLSGSLKGLPPDAEVFEARFTSFL